MKEHSKVSKKKVNRMPIREKLASDTTISIYSQLLRVVFNEAIEAKITESVSYPSGNKRFPTSIGRNIKKAFSTSQIDAIKAYIPPNTLK